LTAAIQAFDASDVSLGSYREPSIGGARDEFIGVQDSGADISSFEISMTNGNGDNYFSVDTLEVEDTIPALPPTSGVPEPSPVIPMAPETSSSISHL
jgi:hypothetical protein